MSFIDDLRVKQIAGGKTATLAQKKASRALPTQKAIIMKEVFDRSGVSAMTAQDQYAHLDDILNARDAVSADIKSAGLKEDDSVIGGVSELICKIGLEAAAPGRYDKLPRGWDWIGDFAITGLPFNLYISVKSYYAKERLIVSGTGQGAAPVIGFGLFKDEKEWSPVRVEQYRHRGFVAIYMPSDLYNALAAKTGKNQPATDITNIYNRPLLRDIKNFANDLKKVVIPRNLIIDLKKL